MSIGDFASAMLGLFIFIICPILIFKWIGGKIGKAANACREKQIQKKLAEKNKIIIEKYAALIKNGVRRYKMAKFILDEVLLNNGLEDEDNPYIVSKDREVFVALPIRDLSKFEKSYNYYCIQRKDEFAKYLEFEGENVTDWFSVENMDGYDEVISYRKRSYAYVSCFGTVERNEKSTLDYEVWVFP